MDQVYLISTTITFFLLPNSFPQIVVFTDGRVGFTDQHPAQLRPSPSCSPRQTNGRAAHSSLASWLPCNRRYCALP